MNSSGDNAKTPVGIPGEPTGTGESPETVSSTGTLGSTPLDREQAEQPATKRELLRLRTHVKETRKGLIEEVCLREKLDDKLASRILTLTHCVDHNEHELRDVISELRQELQDGLEKVKQEIREEFESLLDPIRVQTMEFATTAQEGINAAVQRGMEQLEAIQQKENSDWSEWSLLDMEEFQATGRGAGGWYPW